MRRTLSLLAILPLLLLAACGGGDDGGGGSSGGGGGGATNPDPGPRAPLPSAWQTLDYYFGVELIAGGLNMPVKMDQAPDGRLFVSLLDGDILVIETTPPFTQHPFASEVVLNGSEQGLLGIALSPQFASNGHVFVMVCVNDITNQQQIVRYTATGNTGGSRTVIFNDIPTGNIHNAGGIKFGLDGNLFVSVGDVGNDTLAQTNGSLAGRILRMTPSGGVPTGNPKGAPDEYEWCRGLRNSFGIAVHPTQGFVIGTENGPTNNDELNYLASGKNFQWGDTGGTTPGAEIGSRLRLWPSVIVPTGVTYHSGNTLPPVGYDTSLFLCSYDEARVYRFLVDGTPPVNISEEHVFGQLNPAGNNNKPLDIIEGIDGSLYLSTFTAIWRIYKRTGP